MLDIKLIRKDPEKVKAELAKRGKSWEVIDELCKLDEELRRNMTEVELKRNMLKQLSSEIKKGLGMGADGSQLSLAKRLSDKIKALEIIVGDLDSKLAQLLYAIPNIPHISVPSGGCSDNNRHVKLYGEIRKFDFNPLPHWEIGECLKILDFESASRMSGSNFLLYKGLGAKLERALYTFMVDLHVNEHGYIEIIPPYMVKRDSMKGTGQLPKLEKDMYLCEEDDLFLIPTAEVPLINIHREQMIDERVLPISYVAYTPCFRREAGSYGKDTRGLVRVHQFDKVEMVKFTRPEDSYNALEQMLLHAESVLKLLELPYRVLELCAGEISFASSKTYDIEVWAAGIGKWLEVASISNCEEFQARRAAIRCKKKEGKGTFYPHTLNGSGVALARTYLAILENYQQEDGSVKVPQVIVPYMGGVEAIR
ncbi:MAG: serine--tRNA ligase [Candidatus Aureabacteria bacterium]|nr:serine--tRNA ligase [Candidatus Auribacterota bacterium]